MPESQLSEKSTNIVRDLILENPEVNVMDVGPGEGKWGKILKGKVSTIYGVEVWQQYVRKYRLEEKYDGIFVSDILNYNFEAYNYQVAILGDVLEHIQYDDAVALVQRMHESIDTIFLTLPISLCIQDGNVYGNPYETHVYQWKDYEVQETLGFTLLDKCFNPNGLVEIGTYVLRRGDAK